MEANPGGPQSQETTSCQQLSLPDSNSLRIPQDLLCNHLLWILQDKMGANNSSLTPLNCILKNWDRFDPQGLKKTHLVFLCDTAWPRYPLEDGERWPVGGSLKYNTVLQLDRFCKEQGKWVEVAYVLPFYSLRNMPDLCPKGIDLGVKPSAPSCPLTLPPCWVMAPWRSASPRIKTAGCMSASLAMLLGTTPSRPP